MEYKLLKMQLYKLPWKKLYEGEIPKVNNLKFKEIDDNYYNDINYGLYSGDDEAAFYHAYATYKKLLSYFKDESNSLKKIDLYQDILIQDVNNYLTASVYLTKNDRESILQLILMLGEVCCNEKLINLVLKYWELERENRLETQINYEWQQKYAITLDYPVLFRYFGDKVLYETGDIDLAIRFYQLETLEWIEPKVITDWYSSIATYKTLKDNNFVNFSFKTEIEEMQECFRCFKRFYNLYENAFFYRDNWLKMAEEFARSFERLVNILFVDNLYNTTYKWYEVRDDFRYCFIMALKIHDEAFLWEVLTMTDVSVQKELLSYVLDGVQHSHSDMLKVIKQNITTLSLKKVRNTYDKVYSLLWGAIYVVLIQRILLESDLQKNIGYYTALDTLRFMLPERAGKDVGHLSVMHVAYMNDPNEGKTFWHFIRNRKDVKSNSEYRKVLNYPFVFLKCFTPLIDDLPMWEMYGNHAEGCCVIFKSDWFKENVEVPLYRVCYLRKTRNTYKFNKEDNPNIVHTAELEECLDKLKWIYTVIPNNSVYKKCFREITDQIAFLFKDANYQHEQELRIMYWYNEISNDFKHIDVEYPKLYVSPETHIGIKEIILGPKVRDIPSKVPYLQEELEKMCQKMGYETPEITLSQIEYQ